ncbi:Arylsulfatase [Polystyrenella longa]|uniref:Arylsulfatase n=1 Tax=Polystyrenella longa TaxID=2528007 RepID=A0A518CQE2_9PLAN|nr:sulfatase-like hydrolase/transferase [Polystyrenella longa]QDU81433.1 Arylsulfatase [Polystyrenella longa]
MLSRGFTERRLASLLLILFIGSPITLIEGAEPKSKQSRPNIVIMLTDDLGYNDLGCYDHPAIKTPALDQLAAEGTLFTDCYAAAPVCSPSRAGMLSGRTPHRLGVFDWIPDGSPMHMKADETTFATILKEQGYQTAHIGKWHCNGQFNLPSQPQPNDHGFDYWFSTQNNALPTHHAPVNFVRNGEEVGQLEGYSSDIIVDDAIDWLRNRQDDQPFCLVVWFHSPHEVIATAPEFVKQYQEHEPLERAEYYGNVAQMDAAAGRLLGELDQQQLRDNSFVMFTSDNGPETLNRYGPRSSRSYGLPDPLRGMKLHVYEGGIRVPGIIRWPGHAAAGSVSNEPISGVDVLPTVCALAEIEVNVKKTLDGANILPALAQQPIDRPHPLYWRYDRALSDPKIAIRDGEWKLLVRGDYSEPELYHLTEDVSETQNMASKEPGRLKAMQAQLKTLNEEIAAEAPTWPKQDAKQKSNK